MRGSRWRRWWCNGPTARWRDGSSRLLVVWTAFASVYALLLGYSRVPYAAALDDNYFRIFARVHPRHRIPNVSLLMLAGVSMVFCVLQLADLVAALVVIRILLQFLLQQVGVMVLRHTQPEMERPFRIWFYPLPPLIAIAGFLYILFSRPHFAREIFFAHGGGANRNNDLPAEEPGGGGSGRLFRFA